MSTTARFPKDADPVLATRYTALVNVIMASGLVVSAGAAAILYASPALYGMVFDEMGPTLLGWVAMALPIVIVLGVAGRVLRLGPVAAWAIFLSFAAATGIALACVLGATVSSVDIAFLACSFSFFCLALVGYRARSDLSAIAKFLVLALSGIAAAALAARFLRFGILDFALASMDVLIFAALAAADTDRIRRLYAAAPDSPATRAIFGALTLYLDRVDLPISAFGSARCSQALKR